MEGILALAERILPRASDLWVQSSLDNKQRRQQLFFPRRNRVRRKSIHSNRPSGTTLQLLGAAESADEGVVSRDGIVPARDEPKANCGAPDEFRAKPSRAKRGLVSQTFASWNHVRSLLRQVDSLRGPHETA